MVSECIGVVFQQTCSKNNGIYILKKTLKPQYIKAWNSPPYSSHPLIWKRRIGREKGNTKLTWTPGIILRDIQFSRMTTVCIIVTNQQVLMYIIIIHSSRWFTYASTIHRIFFVLLGPYKKYKNGSLLNLFNNITRTVIIVTPIIWSSTF